MIKITNKVMKHGSMKSYKISLIYKFLEVSLVAQMVKNLPAMQETWVQSLEDSPGEGNGYYFSILAWEIP